MRFTQAEIDAAVAEFKAETPSRVVPAFGYNKDITVYGAENGTVQAPVGPDSGVDAEGDE